MPGMPSTPGTFAGVSLASCQAACARDQDCKFFAMTYDASNKPTCLRYQSTTQNPLALSDCTLAAKLAVWNGLEWSGMQAGRLASGNGPLYVPAAPSHMALHHCLVSVCVCVCLCVRGGVGVGCGGTYASHTNTRKRTHKHTHATVLTRTCWWWYGINRMRRYMKLEGNAEVVLKERGHAGYALCMPRPQRIEYENAFYHVMNRGRERHTIFHGDEYYLCFLETLAQAQLRFKCIVHAYCLMGSHYHLLIETPNANLGRVMWQF